MRMKNNSVETFDLRRRHPLIKRGFLAPNIIMMYAPRTEEELAVAKFIVGHYYAFAKGELDE